MTKLLWCLSFLGAVTACGARVLEAGSNDDDEGGEVEPAQRSFRPPSHSFRCVPGHPDCRGVPCVGEAPQWLAGSWEGELEQFAFPSGSRSVTVHMDGRGQLPTSEGVCGRVIFGQGTQPPLPSDPEALPHGAIIVEHAHWSRVPVEGFVYEFDEEPLTGTNPIAGRRVRFELFTTQPFKAWCEMQYSHRQSPNFGGGWGCLRWHDSSSWSLGGDCAITVNEPGRGQSGPVSCAQLALCSIDPVCACGTGGCGFDTTHRLLIELAFDGASATGNALVDGVQPLRLRHVPPAPPPQPPP